MLPLAGRLRVKAEGFHKARKPLEAKLYTTLHHQVWSLLPGFCRQPRDVPSSFPGLARILGTALNDRPELRVTIATSLRQLVEGSRERGEDRAVLARFAKNYLPILFNLYTGGSEGERLTVLQCVRAYITITDPDLVTSLFSKALGKITEDNLQKENKHRLLDILAVMVAHLPATHLLELLDAISPFLDVSFPLTLPSSIPPSLHSGTECG
jgi:ribosomal RNA-processing protein 12